MGRMQQRLRRDASNIETGTTKSATLFDASSFETKLSGFNGGDVTARTTTDDNDVVFIRSGSETS
jgi:hypothetical protein